MSQTPSNNSEEQLENFLAILTGNSPQPEKEKLRDSTEDNDNQNLESQTEKNQTDNYTEEEFEVLQQLLGKSEIDKLKDRVFDLEVQSGELVAENKKLQKKCQNLETELERQNQLISIQSDTFSELLNESLRQLKQDLLVDINIMLEQFVDENIQPQQRFSIKVAGLPMNNE